MSGNLMHTPEHVLVLDDIQFRLDYFTTHYQQQGDVVQTATHYSQVLAWLDSRVWDLVHLDHDLQDFQDDAEYRYDLTGRKEYYNGMDVVYHIRRMPVEARPKRVIVHSVNPTGGRKMAETLQQAGIPTTWEPFGEPWLIIGGQL